MKSYALAVLFLSVFFLNNDNAYAQKAPVGSDCSRAESTADLTICMNSKYEAHQEALNKTFTELLTKKDNETGIKIREAQNAWIAYRDSECDLESSINPNESLKNLNKLRCLNTLTQNRINVLSGQMQKAAGNPNILPRWMNVVSEVEPDIYWRFGERVNGDLDCDGREEIVMKGLEHNNNEKNAVIVIANTPETGKPQTSFFRIPIIEEGIDGSEDMAPAKALHICSENYTISFGSPDEQDTVNPNQCDASLNMYVPDICLGARITYDPETGIYLISQNLTEDSKEKTSEQPGEQQTQ